MVQYFLQNLDSKFSRITPLKNAPLGAFFFVQFEKKSYQQFSPSPIGMQTSAFLALSAAF